MPSPSPHSENQNSANGVRCSRDVSASPNDEHAWWTSPRQLGSYRFTSSLPTGKYFESKVVMKVIRNGRVSRIDYDSVFPRSAAK